MALSEPWASVVRAGLRSYGALGALIGILAYGRFTLIEEPASLKPCVKSYVGAGGNEQAAIVVYAIYKAALWPASFAWTMAGGTVRPVDWVLARYDPFEGYCGS